MMYDRELERIRRLRAEEKARQERLNPVDREVALRRRRLALERKVASQPHKRVNPDGSFTWTAPPIRFSTPVPAPRVVKGTARVEYQRVPGRRGLHAVIRYDEGGRPPSEVRFATDWRAPARSGEVT